MEPGLAMERHDSGCLLPPGYGELLDSAVEVFQADSRVRTAWVHGSVARGDADPLSDLDLIVAVDDDHLRGFADGWPERLAAIAPTVMARPSFGDTGSWLAITPACRRFDLWVEPTSQVAASPVRDRKVLFDRGSLDALVPAPLPPPGPSTGKIERLREAFAGALAVAATADELLQIDVIHALRWTLYEAYVESNRPLPHTGVKRWSEKLTAAQRETFDTLPTRGDPAPIVAALAEVLGPPPDPLPPPALASALIPPQGTIRGMSEAAAPAGSWARHVSEELFAIHLYLTLTVYRRDWLLGVDGVYFLRRLLYELDVEELDERDPDPSLDAWSGRLSAEQREELLSLPTGEPTRVGVVSASVAVREAFIQRGRRLLGDRWPHDLERAVCDHVDRFIEDHT